MPERSDLRRRLRPPTRAELTWLLAGLCAGWVAMLGVGGLRSADAQAPAPVAATDHAPPDAPAPAPAAPPAAVQLAAFDASAAAPAAVALAGPPRTGRVLAGRIAPGATLAAALREQGASSGAIARIAREMAPHFDFRNARAGHRFELALDPDGEVTRFRYTISDLDGFVMVRDGDEYRVERDQAELVARTARIAGVVTSSLYGAIRDLGESPALAHDFADILAWDLDFSRSAQPGDEFRILYERLYRPGEDGSETYVRPGRILAAHYEGGGGQHTAVYFEPAEGRGGYYRPDGSSVERSILLAPLRYARISSRFTSARRHPILNVTRPHHGIDYAAPTGTPIWAVADGTVSYRGRAGGFGNLVKVRHAKGYVSYYAHLSRFAKGLHVGDAVRQKQVIGYVGQTGLATGPHVCFRIAKDGKYVDPARLHMPAGPPVSDSLRPRFDSTRDILLSELDAGPALVATDEAL